MTTHVLRTASRNRGWSEQINCRLGQQSARGGTSRKFLIKKEPLTAERAVCGLEERCDGVTGGTESLQLRVLTDLHWDTGAARTSISGGDAGQMRYSHDRQTFRGGMQP